MRILHTIVVIGALLLASGQAAAQDSGSADQESESKQAGASVPSVPAGSVDHGRYIVRRLTMCVECHSPRDEKGDIIPGEEFMGAPIPFRPPWPNDWAERAPRNRGLPGYSDEQGVRLLTEGAIDRNGNQLRPPMPRFRMTTGDAADVVAYMKSLE